MGDKARHEDQIKRAVADDLVGNPHIAATGIPGFRPHHRLLPPLVRAESLQSQGAHAKFNSPRKPTGHRSEIARWSPLERANHPLVYSCGRVSNGAYLAVR